MTKVKAFRRIKETYEITIESEFPLYVMVDGFEDLSVWYWKIDAKDNEMTCTGLGVSVGFNLEIHHYKVDSIPKEWLENIISEKDWSEQIQYWFKQIESVLK